MSLSKPVLLFLAVLLTAPWTAAWAEPCDDMLVSKALEGRRGETAAIKANPATGAGFVRRSSWLSHTWCGPFRAGRRGFGYGVTDAL